jgi:hypothetical protein
MVRIELNESARGANPGGYRGGVHFLENESFGLSEGRHGHLLAGVSVTAIDCQGIRNDIILATFRASASGFHGAENRRTNQMRNYNCPERLELPGPSDRDQPASALERRHWGAIQSEGQRLMGEAVRRSDSGALHLPQV